MTELRAVPDRAKGVVNPAAAKQAFRLGRYLPETDLAGVIDHFWLVEWALPEGVTHVQRTLPYPCVHLVFDLGRTAIFGPTSGIFEYTLQGSGTVLGVRFRAGGFRGFMRDKVQTITDRILPLQPLFDCDAAEAERQVFAHGDDAGKVAAASALVRRVLPAPDPQVIRIETILNLIKDHPEITQVQALSERAGISVRSLQLLFANCVGLSPKWAIRRNRVHDAADQLANGGDVDLARLAQSLGYYDQAHFSSDFEHLVGQPPAEYRRNCLTSRVSPP